MDHKSSMMNNIDWNDYRHPKFLQSINLTDNEFRLANLFLKRSTIRINVNQEHLQENALVYPKNNTFPLKIPTQEKISVNI